MYLVCGITGKVGGAAARRLLAEGHKVRSLVRDPGKAAEWAEQGAELVRGDITDAAAVAAALAGVEGAFVMQPTPVAVLPSFPEARAITDSLNTALRQVSPPRLVVLSSVGSQQPSGLGNITQTHLLEEALGDLPYPTVFIRAGAFIENNLPGLGRAASTGWFDSFLQPTDRRFPMIATADIGAEVARWLTAHWSGQKVVELGTPVTPDEIAQAMSEVLGTPVRARAIPREQWAARLGAMGLPADKITPWEEMQDGFNSGWIDFGLPGTESVAGTLSPAQVFAQARAAQSTG
jgi:uncharacterized protein YbjT (DUF2867 family)